MKPYIVVLVISKYLGRTPLELMVKAVSFQRGCSLNLIHLECFAQWRQLCLPPPSLLLTVLPSSKYVDLSKHYLV